MSGGAKETTDRDITQKLLDTLEENGSMNQAQWRKLVLLALYDVIKISRSTQIGLTDMGKRMETLEENSILLIAKKYPKLSISALVTFTVLTVFVVLHLGLGAWLLDLFNIPLPPAP